MNNRYKNEGISGISLILVLIAVIVTGVLVAMYILHVVNIFSKKPMLIIEGTPVIAKEPDNRVYLYVTVRNIGKGSGTIHGVTVVGDGWSASTELNVTIEPGASISLKINLGSTLPPSNVSEVECVLRTNAGELKFKASVLGRG